MKRAVRVAGLAGLLAAVACGHDCTPVATPARPNVVLVTIDTLRADHLGCYGGRTARTPELDRLAAEGALFERCVAQAPITVPSHLSILSSLPLATHGVLRNDGPAPRPVEVLPSIFARAGYRTAAFVSVRHLGPGSMLGRALSGLEEYRAPRRVSVPWRAEETNAQVFPWLGRACREPFFAWVHYFDPHMPYTPPAPFDSAYYDRDPFDPRADGMAAVKLNWFFHDLRGLRARLARQGREIRALKRELGLSTRAVKGMVLDPVGLEAYAADPAARERLRTRLRTVAAGVRDGLPFRRPVTSWLTGVRDVRFPLARYAGEVSYVDREVGRLRAELERLGIADRTIVLVTADHGESLGEHGVWFDHFGLHQPNLEVPLIVWAPGRVPPGRHAELSRGIDVAPTLLALAGLERMPAMEGRDLLAPGGDDQPVVAEAARGLQVMMRVGSWKLIRTRTAFHYVDAFARDAATTELYDLATDPEERDDLVAREPGRAAALDAEIERWLAGHRTEPAGEPVPVAPGMERALRALGYVE